MGRPGLPVGTWGSISARQVAPGRWRARCRFRDYDGKVRYVVRYGKSATAAKNALKIALKDRTTAPGQQEINAGSKVRHLVPAWLARVDASDKSQTTKARYRDIAESFIVQGLGDLLLRELDVPAINRFLDAVKANHGAATAKGAKTCISGMVGLAMSYGAITVNPVRDTDRISVPKAAARALTVAETDDLFKKIRSDPDAAVFDLIDLCDFMAGTGVRVGEACALRIPQVDLGAATVEINATVTRFGLEERPKSDAGWRVISIPERLVRMIEARIANPELNTDLVVFPSPLGRVRDMSNLSGELRRMFDRAGYEWVSSHTFRKTVATRLDEAGMSARQIADHLGHAQVSMTQNTYMGRRAANSDAARVLE